MRQIASVLKSNGTEGELVMSFRDIDPEEIDLKEPVFIIFDGLPVPFYIESLKRKGNTKAIVRLTDISSYEDAEELCSKAVYLEDDSAGGHQEDSLKALIGWTLYKSGDEFDEEVGTISEFYDIPQNPCIGVETKNGEVMIPLHEDFIVAMDPENMEIVLELPEGLVP